MNKCMFGLLLKNPKCNVWLRDNYKIPLGQRTLGVSQR